jgi:protein-tyrosine kinase
MNLIERAGRQLGSLTSKSLVEKAADQLGPADLRRGPDEKPRVPSGAIASRSGDASAGVQRETRRQISLDGDRLRAAGFALPDDQSFVAEEFRLIKRPLLTNAFGHVNSEVVNPNLIMVTSANPNEGKTFVAINLALSVASEHGVHVLLIDADVAKPSVPAILGFEAERGLIDAVADPSVDLSDVMIRTNIENLTILPAGLARPGSTELLASSRMAQFVSDIAKRYPDRIVIFDSPPVLARSEPMVLARHVGQIVFVVEAERTSRSTMNEALRLLGTNKLGGIVLNKVPHVREGFGRHYAYYGR